MRYNVKVRFSSDGSVKIEGEEIVVSIRSAPEKGKANQELVKVLSNYFGLHSNGIRIVSGYNSRNKIVEVID
jgi:uncharacterized protein (TIGR00251 family)